MLMQTTISDKPIYTNSLLVLDLRELMAMVKDISLQVRLAETNGHFEM